MKIKNYLFLVGFTWLSLVFPSSVFAETSGVYTANNYLASPSTLYAPDQASACTQDFVPTQAPGSPVVYRIGYPDLIGITGSTFTKTKNTQGLLTYAVDPVFQKKMTDTRALTNLPVTPVYDLVVNVPIAFSYCLSTHPEKYSAVPAQTIPSVRAYLALGQEKLLEGSLIYSGKGEIYQWKIPGWDTKGIVPEDKLEKIIKSVQNKDDSVKVGIYYKPNTLYQPIENSINFDLCVPVYGASPKLASSEVNRIVFVRGKNSYPDVGVINLSSDLDLLQVLGIDKVEPYKTYSEKGSQGSHFALYMDLGLYDDVQLSSGSIQDFSGAMTLVYKSSCHSDGSPTKYFLTTSFWPEGTNSLAFTLRGLDIIFLTPMNSSAFSPSTLQIRASMLLHEYSHTFAGLVDEYKNNSLLPPQDVNCSLNTEPMSLSVPGGITLSPLPKGTWFPYGDAFVGCNNSTNVRPSYESIMKTVGRPNFNVVSCGYILKAIKKNDDMISNWKQCMKMDGVIKPTTTGLTGFNNTTLLASLGDVLKKLIPLPSVLNTAQAFGGWSSTPPPPPAPTSKDFIDIEEFAPDGRIISNQVYISNGDPKNPIYTATPKNIIIPDSPVPVTLTLPTPKPAASLAPTSVISVPISQSVAPSIVSISPLMVKIGDTITVRGINFTGVLANNIYIKSHTGIVSPTQITTSATQIIMKVPNLPNGSYSLQIKTSGGSSNTVSFSVTTTANTNTSLIQQAVNTLFESHE